MGGEPGNLRVLKLFLNSKIRVPLGIGVGVELKK